MKQHKANIANNANFKSFECKTKFIGNTEGDGANGILKHTTLTVPLKYLSNFWRSLEIPLISYEVELKLKWTKYCVLSAAGADNADNIDSKNIIFTIKDTKLYVPVKTLSARYNQKLSKILAKDLKDQFIGTNKKQKVRIKIRQMNLDISLN